MKNFLLKLWAAIRGAAKVVAPYALPVVKELAAATPTRADDELIAVSEKYGAKIVLIPGMTWSERGNLLHQIAVEYLTRVLPFASGDVAAGVKLAYEIYKGAQSK